jgi:hypothetical protein
VEIVAELNEQQEPEPMKKIDTRVLVAGIAIVAAFNAVGCRTAGPQHSNVVHSLSPELLTTNQRDVDVQNMTSLTWNSHNRMIWDDLSRAALTDRPSRLSKHPVPH